MTLSEEFERATIVIKGVGSVIDYDAFSPVALKRLDELTVDSLQGRARGDYYALRLIKYLRSLDKLPADANGAVYMKGISVAANVPYQNLFGAGKLSPMIELARKRKGLERWSEVVARQNPHVRQEGTAEDKKRIKALEERLRVALEERDEARALRAADKERYEKRIRELEARYLDAQFFDAFLLDNNGRVLE